MSPDNIITNREVDAGTLPESQRENVPQQSLQVSANNLVNPPRATNLTPPVLETPPQTGTANAVSKDLGEIITAQTKEASDLRARRSEFAELGNLGTLGDFRTQQLADLGVPDNVRQLKDIQLQLADVDTASDLTKTRIQGGAGQTAGQAGREVTQEDRENAVRRSGLAAQASVLQGNIQTATTLVNQAVQTAYQDRTLKNSNLLNQINDLSGTVDNQTQQLLDQEKARIEADQAAVKEVKDSVALAMQSGAATPEEVAQLTDINATDADRLSLAQSITARGATEDRDLSVEAREASIEASQATTAVKAEQLFQLQNPTDITRSTQIVDIDGVKTLVDTQTGETIQSFEAGTTTNDIEVARGTAFVNTIDSLKTDSGLNSSVGPTFLNRTAGIDALSGAKDDFVASVENVVKTLTLNTFAEAKEKGMTFGAMSQGEWNILGDSATKISNFRVYEKEGIPGFRTATDKVSGYDASQKDFLVELDSISNFAKMDAIRRGSKPEDVGVVVTEDGSHWTQNSDGSFTELEITPIQ